MKIGFAGLGVMGAPMARHLVQSGHDVAGFNRSPDKARAWAEATNGRFAATVGEAAASGADLFVLCVGNDDDVRAVVPAGLSSLGVGAVIVDHTTTSAKCTASASPWTTPAMAIWLTILVSWPEPDGPICFTAFE